MHYFALAIVLFSLVFVLPHYVEADAVIRVGCYGVQGGGVSLLTQCEICDASGRYWCGPDGGGYGDMTCYTSVPSGYSCKSAVPCSFLYMAIPACFCSLEYASCISCFADTSSCGQGGNPCGDGTCSASEDCVSCELDCGRCGGGGGGGGGGGPPCGNNILQPGEECDEGTNNGVCPKICSSTCQSNNCLGVCGNNRIEPPETCDDGNQLNGDGCDEFCQNEVVSCTDDSRISNTNLPSVVFLNTSQTYTFWADVENTGNTYWWHGSAYRFGPINTNVTLNCGSDPDCNPGSVGPGGEAGIGGITITAPSTPGIYPFAMRMRKTVWGDYLFGDLSFCGPGPPDDIYFGGTLTTTVVVQAPDSTPPFGSIDYPNGNTLKGTVFPYGWALDQRSMVNGVTVQFRGPTDRDYSTNVCVNRVDVCNIYSIGYSYAACSGSRCDAGWSSTVDTLSLQPGSYQVSAYACDTNGNCGYLSGSPRTATVNQCFGVTCNNPQPNTCASPTSVNVFNPAGTCNPATGACSYTSSVVACGPSQACVNGVCVDPCGGFTCNTPPSNFCTSNVLTNHTNPGTCVSPGGVPTCDYTPVPITCTIPDDVCIGSTLRDYTSASCSANQCTATYTDVVCSYGCSFQAGNDVCNSNPAPVLTGINRAPAIVKIGQTISMTSVGSDPGGELVRIRCGTTSGATNLCTSGYVTSDPSCSGANSFWADSAVHTIYCFLQDNAATPASSSVLSTTITTDNTNPTASVAINDSRSPIPANTPVTLTAIANDANGLSAVRIFVDSVQVMLCGASPCNYVYTPAYGVHSYYAIANDTVGNQFQTAPSQFTINNAPSVSPITYTGSCTTGSTIILNCNAADPNQAANTLGVKAWAGQCEGSNCFATRSWATGIGTTYASNAAMTAPGSGGQFTLPITITQPSGTAVAATCQATDALSVQSTFGDAYPLCVVNGCASPPVITIDSVVPNPAKAGNVRITFTSDRALMDNPSVVIRPGSQIGGTIDYPATLFSRNVNTYIYDVSVLAGYLNNIADIRISATGSTDSCPITQINQFTIDTAPPSTSILCNGAACTSQVYGPSATVTLSCSDATTSCSNTYYTVNGGAQQTYNQASPPVFGTTGVYNINYWSTDAAGNVETANSRTVQVYSSGFGNEQTMVSIISIQPRTALFGQTVNANVSCFLRNVGTGLLTRMCNVNQNGVDIIIDRGTVKRKNYFSTLGITRANFLTTNLVNLAQNVVIGQQTYAITKHWRVPLDTNIFSSEICVNMTDFDSGLNGEACDNYTVSNSQLVPQITFPDIANLVIPATATGAPNFTKTMPIIFNAIVGVQTGFSTSACTDVSCRVEYSFIPFGQWDPVTNPPHVASWSGFANAYAPTPADASSNYFMCDQYRTLYVRATKQGGPDNGITAETQKDFFINCNTRVTITPPEKRLVLGAQPGTVFDVTVWNPKEGLERTFDMQSIVPDAYVLSWINFQCPVGQTGCSVDPTNDDIVTLAVPQISSRTVQVSMPSAVRSGSFSVTFVATENSVSYSTLGMLLIFVEGLNEFAVWQLAGLFIIAVGIYVYSRNNAVKAKKRR